MAAANPTAPQPAYRDGSKKGFGSLLMKIISKILFFLVVAFVLIYTLFPFVWAIISSVSPDAQLARTPTRYWPETIDWSHYEFVLNNGDFTRAFRNSVIVSVSTVIISLVFGSVAAYALGRMKFRGRSVTLYLILAMTMFPQIAILGSLFQMVRNFGLYDRLPALISTQTVKGRVKVR